jgi:hypothetical protein
LRRSCGFAIPLTISQNLFLVGGFGESDYLRQQLEISLDLWDIRFRTPEESWTAIVRGAVVCGIEKGSVDNLRRSISYRHSYAICVDELFSEQKHVKSDKVETKQNTFAQSQLLWLLNEGDVILADQPRRVEREFDIEFPRSRLGFIPFPIYRHSMSDDERGPIRFGNAKDGKPF